MWKAMDNVRKHEKMWVVSEWWRCMWKWCHHRKKICAYFIGIFGLKVYFTVLCEERPWDHIKFVTLEIVSTGWHGKWPHTTGAEPWSHVFRTASQLTYLQSRSLKSHCKNILRNWQKILTYCNKDALIINKSSSQAMFWYNRDSCHVPSKQPLLCNHWKWVHKKWTHTNRTWGTKANLNYICKNKTFKNLK